MPLCPGEDSVFVYLCHKGEVENLDWELLLQPRFRGENFVQEDRQLLLREAYENWDVTR